MRKLFIIAILIMGAFAAQALTFPPAFTPPGIAVGRPDGATDDHAFYTDLQLSNAVYGENDTMILTTDADHGIVVGDIVAPEITGLDAVVPGVVTAITETTITIKNKAFRGAGGTFAAGTARLCFGYQVSVDTDFLVSNVRIFLKGNHAEVPNGLGPIAAPADSIMLTSLPADNMTSTGNVRFLCAFSKVSDLWLAPWEIWVYKFNTDAVTDEIFDCRITKDAEEICRIPRGHTLCLIPPAGVDLTGLNISVRVNGKLAPRLP